MKIFEIITARTTGLVNENINWNEMDNDLSVDDKLTLLEQYIVHGNFVESVSEHTAKSFESLTKLSDPLVPGNSYIVVPLIITDDRAISLAKPSYAEYIGSSDSELEFNTPDGQKRYPAWISRSIAIYHTFAFASQQAYGKFRMALSLEFDVLLPDVARGGDSTNESVEFLPSILEETYDDDDKFFKAYGVMCYEEDNILHEAEYQGRKVTLNKPIRTSGGPKKFSVYVKNEKGNVVKVNFGQKGARIKKNNPGRRKNFRARHNCDTPGPKTSARYWSCRAW